MGSVRDGRTLPGIRASQTTAKASFLGGVLCLAYLWSSQTHHCSMMHSKLPRQAGKSCLSEEVQEIREQGGLSETPQRLVSDPGEEGSLA